VQRKRRRRRRRRMDGIEQAKRPTSARISALAYSIRS